MAGKTEPTTDQSFEKDVLQSTIPVLVDFWAEWCGPCRALAPKLEEVAAELGEAVKIAKLNVDENPNTASRYNVRGIPTMILFKDGREVDQIVGGHHPKENIIEFIRKHS